MIDLRSDTVTKPTSGMLKAMAEAEVGDDVYGEDPTVKRLEAMTAEKMGKQSGLFVPSGTQSNLIALLTHCGRGDEYLCGQTAHTYRYEGGGAAVLGGIQPQPMDFEPDGTLDFTKLRKYIKPTDPHFARTKLLCLENTQGGKALPMEYLKAAGEFAAQNGLNLHLDGARIFNAAVKQGVSAAEIAAPFNTVSVCLSKGLGAPVGSVLCGDRSFIKEARRWRKVVGGGMRQAGILAAAGIYALENNVQRLAQDHQNAALLAESLRSVEGIQVEYQPSQTNMVFVCMDQGLADSLGEFMKNRGVMITADERIRLVTHLDVSERDIVRFSGLFREFFVGRD